MKLNLMSMEQLDEIVRNENDEDHLREAALKELSSRERIVIHPRNKKSSVRYHYYAPGL